MDCHGQIQVSWSIIIVFYSNLISSYLHRKSGQLPGDFSMSPAECLELFDALEAALGKKAVAGIEPKKVRTEENRKRSLISDV